MLPPDSPLFPEPVTGGRSASGGTGGICERTDSAAEDGAPLRRQLPSLDQPGHPYHLAQDIPPHLVCRWDNARLRAM